MTLERIGIITSGGDAPGMNAAIRAATMITLSQGVEVLGIARGYTGLLEDDIEPLGANAVAHILRDGGTLLGTGRCPAMLERTARDRARAVLAAHGIDGLLVIGGNGSLTGALALSDPAECEGEPVQVVGIPASIDNDIGLTGLSIGVDTAINTIVDACDKIADTAAAHNRTFIVEVMGRDCGYLAMTSSIASGADAVLFPEANKSEDELVDIVVKAVTSARRRERGHRRVIVIKAEGVRLSVDQLKTRVDEQLAARGEPDVGGRIETRVTVLGHVVRGGRPSAFDRLLGSRLANVAARSLLAGATRKMAAWMPPVELPEEVGYRTDYDPYCWLVDLEAAITETDQLLAGASGLARWRAGVFDELEDVFLL